MGVVVLMGEARVQNLDWSFGFLYWWLARVCVSCTAAASLVAHDFLIQISC